MFWSNLCSPKINLVKNKPGLHIIINQLDHPDCPQKYANSWEISDDSNDYLETTTDRTLWISIELLMIEMIAILPDLFLEHFHIVVPITSTHFETNAII